MTSTTHSPLATAATSTFEALGLLLPDLVPSAEQRAAPLAHGVRVAFAGPLAGAVTVRVSGPVAATLAANMLGVHAVAADDPLVRDALGELANVICGNLLPALAGRAAVFHLAAPAPARASPVSPADDERPALAVVLGIDAGRAEVELHLATAPDAP